MAIFAKKISKRTKRVLTTIGISFVIIVGLYIYSHSTDAKESESKNKVVHISIDDVTAFKDLTEKKYYSIFDHPFFRELKDLHDKFGLIVTLYTYQKIEEGHGYYIETFPQTFQSEFKKNSDWLKIGFHWISPEFNAGIGIEEFRDAYNSLNRAIANFADSSVISRTLRIHYFYLPDSLLRSVKGINTLLCAEDNKRQSYDLSKGQSQDLYQRGYLRQNGITYLPTDIRIENYVDIERKLRSLQNKDTLVIFTHQWALDEQSFKDILSNILHNGSLRINRLNRLNLEKTLEWLNNHNYKYSFL